MDLTKRMLNLSIVCTCLDASIFCALSISFLTLTSGEDRDIQELLAPELRLFCDANWTVLGHSCTHFSHTYTACWHDTDIYGEDLSKAVSEITGIPEMCLKDSSRIPSFNTAQKMSWASQRHTSRKEDEAYCLLGIFQVNMPLMYGEGDAAFFRLEQEIIRESADQSIFAWLSETRMTDPFVIDRSRPFPYQPAPLFAVSPRHFANSGETVPITGHLKTAVRALPFPLTNLGLEIHATLLPICASNVSDYDTFLMRLRVDPGGRGSSKHYYEIALIRFAEAYGENRFARLYTGDLGSVVHRQGARSIEQLIYIDTGRKRLVDISPFLARRDSLVQKARKLTVPITAGGGKRSER